jgi:polar amino acid transport system permease protein
MKKKSRFKLLDLIVILLCIAAIGFLYYRISSDDKIVLDYSDLGQYFFKRNVDTGRLEPNFLIIGLISTIKLSLWSLFPATIIGVVFGLFRTSGNRFLGMVGRTYVELIRNLPPLVLIFIFYFFVADQIMPLLGIDSLIRSLSPGGESVLEFFFTQKTLFTNFLSGVFTLAFFEGAYITEIVRSGIESIERGQMEAAYSLGLSWADEMRFIILPQAIRRVIPALAGEFISLIKYSSITSVVSIQELTYLGRNVNLIQGNFLTVWTTVAALYMVLTFSLSMLASRLEVRMARAD